VQILHPMECGAGPAVHSSGGYALRCDRAGGASAVVLRNGGEDAKAGHEKNRREARR